MEAPFFMVTFLLVVFGFCAGLLGALTGIGGGVLLTPILALHFGIPIREAIGTSLVAVITTSAASSSVHLQRHTTDIRLGMTLELATALGVSHLDLITPDEGAEVKRPRLAATRKQR